MYIYTIDDMETFFLNKHYKLSDINTVVFYYWNQFYRYKLMYENTATHNVYIHVIIAIIMIPKPYYATEMYVCTCTTK